MVKVCNTLLNSYDTNTETTNHCVVKMLYRIAFECKLPAMLFQASLFIKFRDILANYEPKYKGPTTRASRMTMKTKTTKATMTSGQFPKPNDHLRHWDSLLLFSSSNWAPPNILSVASSGSSPRSTITSRIWTLTTSTRTFRCCRCPKSRCFPWKILFSKTSCRRWASKNPSRASAAAGETVDVLGRNDSAPEDSENDNQESLTDRKTSIKNIQKKRKTSRLQQFVRGNSADRSSSDSENDVPEHIFPQQSSISRKRYASDDSSDEENRDPANGESMPAVLRKKRTALDSDDDEPDSISDRVDGRIGVSIEESATLNGDSMAGSANRPKRNRNALDSDDDAPEAADDSRTSPQGLKKKRNFLNSDEEDERESGNSSPANIANGKSPGAAPARRKSHILDSEEEGPDLDEVSTNPSQKDSEISQSRFEETDQRSQERIFDLGDNESSKCHKRPLDSDDGEMGKSVKKTRTDCDVISEATQNETEMTAATERDEEPTIRVKRRSARKIESDDSD
ncbi:unnamed protein product [Nesidiocoris tenuis]|uniref:Timeless N-terminal domain-containing protein n=1 Tax=Nesidiocoris tenuis TaxID=355587 RepID=A0A6H5GIJ2_9HEMI|nr:unnamed protein product [Nesidiocoris tenuis]